MKRLPLQGRTLAIVAIVLPLLVLFVYVALRSGPLAPVLVKVASVESRSISPALFGVGIVESRYSHKIGPTHAGRLKSVHVQVGDLVRTGQLLGEMDPIDIDDRILAQNAALRKAKSQLNVAKRELEYAQAQSRRYAELLVAESTSEEIASLKKHELEIAEENLIAAQKEVSRALYEQKALIAQRENLRLLAPVDGLVVARNSDPGTTLLAGQEVVEIIEPYSLWINTRFDQVNAKGLKAGLAARINLRSKVGEFKGQVFRVEPVADSVTEELIAKVSFVGPLTSFPIIGELAEVTVQLPPLAPSVAVPNAAIQKVDGDLGVWVVSEGDLKFNPVEFGESDLNGYIRVHKGLKIGDQVVVYSERSLSRHSRIKGLNSLTE